MGLGLYLVKAHIRQLQGSISMESSPQGTTLSLKIPLQTSTSNQKDVNSHD